MTVYFIRAGEGPLVKIGTTTNLAKRVATLQYDEKKHLDVIGIIDGDRFVEIFLHGVFAEYREVGEWFRYEGRLKRYIEAQNDADRAFSVQLPALRPTPEPWSYEESARRHGEGASEALAELQARPDFDEIMAREDDKWSLYVADRTKS